MVEWIIIAADARACVQIGNRPLEIDPAAFEQHDFMARGEKPPSQADACRAGADDADFGLAADGSGRFIEIEQHQASCCSLIRIGPSSTHSNHAPRHPGPMRSDWPPEQPYNY